MYVYEQMKPYLFSDQGQRDFIKVRDRVNHLLKSSGAFRMDHAMGICGSTFEDLACVDRLIELGEIVELPRKCWGQFRVFSTPEVSTR